MSVLQCEELSGQELISYIKRRGIKVERNTPEYEAIHRELEKAGENIEKYGCSANLDFYKELIELLPEEEREDQKKILEMHLT
ncbi:MAG: hypothetical protein ACE5J7_01520 [Candidatus Aenigmatarchaeota archaeon]